MNPEKQNPMNKGERSNPPFKSNGHKDQQPKMPPKLQSDKTKQGSAKDIDAERHPEEQIVDSKENKKSDKNFQKEK